MAFHANYVLSVMICLAVTYTSPASASGTGKNNAHLSSSAHGYVHTSSKSSHANSISGLGHSTWGSSSDSHTGAADRAGTHSSGGYKHISSSDKTRSAYGSGYSHNSEHAGLGSEHSSSYEHDKYMAGHKSAREKAAAAAQAPAAAPKKAKRDPNNILPAAPTFLPDYVNH